MVETKKSKMKSLSNWLRDKLDSSEERIYELEVRPLKNIQMETNTRRKREVEEGEARKDGKEECSIFIEQYKIVNITIAIRVQEGKRD